MQANPTVPPNLMLSLSKHEDPRVRDSLVLRRAQDEGNGMRGKHRNLSILMLSLSKHEADDRTITTARSYP